MHDLREEVRNYIKQHMSEAFTIDDMARDFYITKYYFCRTFKENTGYTVKKYVNRIRFEEARKQLRAGISVTQVAQNCGFLTVNGFDKAYKKFYGYPPKEERKRYYEEK